MLSRRLLPLAAAALLACPTLSFALSPFQFGFGGENHQLVPPDEPVCGLRLNLVFSENDTASGLDLGVFSLSNFFTGLQVDLFAFTEREFNGLGFGFLHSVADLNGVQLAFFPISDGTFTGLQFGAFPKAADMHGLQIGAVTRADSLHGVQIGIINIVYSAELSWTPFLRISF